MIKRKEINIKRMREKEKERKERRRGTSRQKNRLFSIFAGSPLGDTLAFFAKKNGEIVEISRFCELALVARRELSRFVALGVRFSWRAIVVLCCFRRVVPVSVLCNF